jgi:hypothetical protein
MVSYITNALWKSASITPTRPAQSIMYLVYAISWGFGLRRAFAILPIAELFVADGRAVYTALNPMIGGTLDKLFQSGKFINPSPATSVPTPLPGDG